MAQSFEDVLGTFVDAAASTELQESGRVSVPTGEYNLEVGEATFEPKTNQYGPYVMAKVKFSILDAGDLQGRGFGITFLVNTTKDGKLSFGGQDLVKLGNVLAGEPIQGNNPQTAASIIMGSKGSVIRSRVFTTKKGYLGIDPMSLEAAPSVSA